MLRLSIHRALTGMRVALPVLLPERPEHILLKPGAELDEPTIRALIAFGVHTLCVEYPPTAFLLRTISPAVVSAQSHLATRVMECIDSVTSTRHADFDFLQYTTGVRSLIHSLMDDPACAMFIENVVDSGDSNVSHAFNVGVLSLMMGMRLDGYLVMSRKRVNVRRAQNIENLGMAALLHDLGMLRLPGEVVARWNTTQDERDLEWREHVALGYDMLKGKVPPTAAAAVLHHHQRLDGGGFPKQIRLSGPSRALEGRDIHVFARVIAVADVFDRARTNPGGKARAVPAVRALRRTLELVRAGRLDPVVFRALLSVVPAFAPGSLVVLSDAQAYIVTGWHPCTPCHPTVCRVPIELAGTHSDIDLSKLDPAAPLGAPVDLRQRSDLWVVRTEGEHVEADLFSPAFVGEFDLKAPFPISLVGPLDPWMPNPSSPHAAKDDPHEPLIGLAMRRKRRKAS